MTPAERLAARITKNREIDERVKNAPPPPEKARKRAASAGSSIRPKAADNALDKFHEIKKMHGIDAATEYLENLRHQND
jgi:hypothetical protein